MPAFSVLFPDASVSEPYRADGAGEIYALDHDLPCVMCQAMTPWVEVCAESPMCSTECSKKFWDELNEACRQSTLAQVDDNEEIGF